MSDVTRALDATGLDHLVIQGLEIYAHHGVFDFERREGQIFVIDLDLEIETRRAAASDALVDTLDYGQLVASVKAAVERDPVDLIETLAERIAAVCLASKMVERVEVTVHKPQAPIDATFTDVALRINRSRA